jgi:hypothetical protein
MKIRLSEQRKTVMSLNSISSLLSDSDKPRQKHYRDREILQSLAQVKTTTLTTLCNETFPKSEPSDGKILSTTNGLRFTAQPPREQIWLIVLASLLSVAIGLSPILMLAKSRHISSGLHCQTSFNLQSNCEKG